MDGRTLGIGMILEFNNCNFCKQYFIVLKDMWRWHPAAYCPMQSQKMPKETGVDSKMYSAKVCHIILYITLKDPKV